MMKKIREMVSAFLTLAFLVGVGFCGGYAYSNWKEEKSEEAREVTVTENNLPGVKERRLITNDEIETALYELRQLTVYAGEYTVRRSEKEVREFLIPDYLGLTSNEINMECIGTVKVGYDVDEISVAVDTDSEKIYIKLPEAKVLDNYLIWDSVKCTERNNMLNPIEFSQYEVLIHDMEMEGLRDAEELGIYEEARAHTERIIRQYLEGLTEYEVVFL